MTDATVELRKMQLEGKGMMRLNEGHANRYPFNTTGDTASRQLVKYCAYKATLDEALRDLEV